MKTITYLVLIAAAATMLWLWNGKYAPSRAVAAAPEGDTGVVTVQRGDILVEVTSSATITPENKLEIKPPIAGRAETVLVDIGQEVKRGQSLAMMSSSERAALLDAARAKGPKEVAFWEDVYKTAPLVAPINGVIISRTLVPGQVVTTGDVAFIMSDLLIAKANMDETDLAKIYMGQRAAVTLDSYPDDKIEGEVSKIAYNSTTTNNVTTYPVDVTMKTIPEFARSGMTANVAFMQESKTNVLILPVDAIGPDNTVQLATQNGSAGESRKVVTGLSDGKNIEIKEGLAEGQRILHAAYQLPEQKKAQGFSLLPRAKRVSGDRPTSGSSPPRP
jgi:macrolide-specific efflux system membrane fusion protein